MKVEVAKYNQPVQYYYKLNYVKSKVLGLASSLIFFNQSKKIFYAATRAKFYSGLFWCRF